MNQVTIPTVLLLILHQFLSFCQPGGSIWDMDESPKIIKQLDGECILLELDLGKLLIVRDCPDYDYFEFDSDRAYGIKVDPVCLKNNCILQVEVYFNNILIRDVKTDGYINNPHEIPIDYQFLESLLGPEFTGIEADLKIVLTKKCFENFGDKIHTLVSYDPIVEIIPIQVRGPGEKYVADIIVDDYTRAICEELYNNDKTLIRKIDLCCQGSLDINFQVSKTSGTKISFTGTVVKMEPSGLLGASFSIDYSISNYQISQTVQSFGISYTKEPENDACIFPGFSARILRYEKCLFEVNCDGPDHKDVVLDEYEEIVEIDHYICSYDHDCPTQDPKPRINITPHNNPLSYDCLTDLAITLENPVYDMNYEFEWTGPGGNYYYSEILTNVAYGKYELRIFDECCNEYNYTYNICDHTLFGTWYYEDGKYCREVVCYCEGILSLRNSETYTMCVNAHRHGDWYFNETTKKCNRHAYWTDQDGVEWDLTFEVGETDILQGHEPLIKEPEIYEYYDEFMEKCIREYQCNGNFEPGASQQFEPEFGAWEYDEFWETCYREVFCYGNQVFDQGGFDVLDESDYLSIDWTVESEWDLFCTGRVYCEDELQDFEINTTPEAIWTIHEILPECLTTYLSCDGTIQPNITEPPSSVYDWEWDGQDLCSRELFCENANDYFVQYAGALFAYDPSNQAGCDTENGMYSYQVNCDNDQIIGWFCIPQEPPIAAQNSENQTMNGNETTVKDANKLNRTIHPQNRDSFFVEYDFDKYTAVISTIEGIIQQQINFKNQKNYDRLIQNFLNQAAAPNQLFIVSVFGDNKLVFTKKIIKFK